MRRFSANFFFFRHFLYERVSSNDCRLRYKPLALCTITSSSITEHELVLRSNCILIDDRLHLLLDDTVEVIVLGDNDNESEDVCTTSPEVTRLDTAHKVDGDVTGFVIVHDERLVV